MKSKEGLFETVENNTSTDSHDGSITPYCITNNDSPKKNDPIVIDDVWKTKINLKKSVYHSKSVRKLIIDADDRKQVISKKFPYNCIALLRIKMKNTTVPFYGTGFFISNRCVITAGHCVFNKGSWAEYISVIPGANLGGEAEPFGQATSNTFYSVEGWTINNDYNFDYGAVILPDDTLYNNIKDFFQYDKMSDTDVVFELSGYPSDKNEIQYKTDVGEVQKNGHRLFHTLDTKPGHSGSPVFVRRNEKCIAVGVHHFANTKDNAAIQINDDVIANFKKYEKMV